VLWFIKTGQQLIHHVQHIQLVIFFKPFDPLTGMTRGETDSCKE